jgi:hypothetical protein
MRNIKKQAEEIYTKAEWCEIVMTSIFTTCIILLILVVIGG